MNPTPIQFRRSFKKLLCINLFHSGTENCEADADQILLRLNDIQQQDISSDTGISVHSINKSESDYQTHEMLQKNFTKYICGYLIKKTLSIHSCDTSIKFAKAQEDLDDSSLFCYFKAYENANMDLFGNLNVPTS